MELLYAVEGHRSIFLTEKVCVAFITRYNDAKKKSTLKSVGLRSTF